MSQVLVWKSDTDGKLFEDKSKYLKHLRKLAEFRSDDRKIAKANAARDQFMIDMGKTVTSIANLEQFIKDNWKWFAANGAAHNTWRKARDTAHKLVAITITAQWSDSVSNSHRCPRNGVTNWDPRRSPPGTPTSYPGWRGQIKFQVDAGYSNHKVPRQYDGSGSDYFDGTIIQTGSGGSGNGRNYNYSIELFAADFPAMADEHYKLEVWNLISDQQVEFE